MTTTTAARERPILFSAPMVRALLAGTKSQTRRVVKLREQRGVEPWDLASGNAPLAMAVHCPYGVAGERLWVRETWAPRSDLALAKIQRPFYAATNGIGDMKNPWRWRPSIHMPRWACRIVLEITDVRVQRLHEISEDDAVAEGIAPLFTDAEKASSPECAASTGWTNYLWHGHIGRSITPAQAAAWAHQFSGYDKASASYASLWESINGAAAWDANPWVWALTFRRVTP